MRRHVLHVAQPPDAGVPRVVRDLVLDQIERGYRVSLASPAGGDLVKSLAGTECHHYAWDASRYPRPATIGESRRFRRIFKDAMPDLVHLHSAKAGLVGRLVVRGSVSTVWQPHAWSFQAVEGPMKVAATMWERFASRWNDVTVCVSRGEAELARAAGIGSPIEVVPNGIDLERWHEPRQDDASAARASLGIPSIEPIVVCVGRLSVQKGQDLLLKAWPTVTASHPDARLYLVGDGPERSALEALAGSSVRLVGGSNDVRSWLLASDIVAIPSRWEGMSIAMLEAMATSCCVVSSDVAGAREALGQEAGVVVPRTNAGALAAAIIDLLNDRDRRQRLGSDARRKVERDHDLARVCEHVVSIYERIRRD